MPRRKKKNDGSRIGYSRFFCFPLPSLHTADLLLFFPPSFQVLSSSMSLIVMGRWWCLVCTIYFAFKPPTLLPVHEGAPARGLSLLSKAFDLLQQGPACIVCIYVICRRQRIAQVLRYRWKSNRSLRSSQERESQFSDWQWPTRESLPVNEKIG